ncbi:alkaline phosphatase D family protein [Steroidobacter agaridevorans]|uniref:alkaline phosphatase D family protein n=1 Tax=Steroidobacter agaridevorans TaxID=2695856 RepID=UPI00132AE5FD|nr:alkaline phosphatase D family protein [Steroidobacter agaridevorans]GFE85084.1 extracelullar DNA degradation protein EddA [Steroidobacter agaridevorans]
MTDNSPLSRRTFLQQAALGGVALTGIGGILYSKQAPAIVTSDSVRPMANWGLQIGDVIDGRAIVWSRADRPARMIVEWSLDETFKRSKKIRGPHALEVSDFTSRIDLTRLPDDSEIFVRVSYQDLDSGRATSEPLVGQFRTPPSRRRDIRFVWSGDTAGQGWGIDLGFGGMKIYEAMRQVRPDFFIHSGDTIYADGPMVEHVNDAAGNLIWTNAFLDEVPEKLKVAETLHEYRRNHLYNRYDTNIQRFSAEVPQIWQWDDHEVTNNWSDSKVLDARYTEKRIQTLTARATRAFLEHSPMRWYNQAEEERIYRHIPYGRDLDVFVIDMRSYRGPNSHNLQVESSADTAFLGKPQLEWLKQKLKDSRTTWKVIAADMPLGVHIPDGTDEQGRAKWEGPANGNDGPASGRELEIAELLRFIKREDIRNIVWLTADVHYCAAHYYDPNKAVFQDFAPFWEFVAGPLNSGSFGPNAMDKTFGPQVIFQKAPPAANTPPNGGFQFFGQIDIDEHSKVLSVALKDLNGTKVFGKQLEPRPNKGDHDRWD